MYSFELTLDVKDTKPFSSFITKYKATSLTLYLKVKYKLVLEHLKDLDLNKRITESELVTIEETIFAIDLDGFEKEISQEELEELNKIELNELDQEQINVAIWEDYENRY